MVPGQLQKQFSRANDALRRSSDVISEQERLVRVLRGQGRPTERAEELLASFKDAHIALTEYQQELESRIKERPSAGEETEVTGFPVTYL